jgi:hypothetical protein
VTAGGRLRPGHGSGRGGGGAVTMARPSFPSPATGVHAAG